MKPRCSDTLPPLLAVACSLLLASQTGADSPARGFHDAARPASGPPSAIGGYSAGCLRGGEALPLRSERHRVTRPERRRHFGHPTLVAYLQGLFRRAERAGLGKVWVGDLSQPRGGPAPSGHSSHQTGLDVDIWYAAKRASPKLEPLSVVRWKQRTLNRHWTPKIGELLRVAADDPQVARIFVNPVIKQELCATSQGDRAFLTRLRPWYGHDDHFHVRMKCPAGDAQCKPQAPPKAGDGCDDLDYWLSEKKASERKRGQKRYQATVGAKPPLPEACDAVLAAAPARPEP